MKKYLCGLLFLLFSINSIAMEKQPRILILGDSLSAGYGLTSKQSWVVLLQQKLQQEHYTYQIINASISGITTADGLARLPSLLKNHPNITIIALGANDALRGFSINITQQNLSQMILLAQQHNSKVLLAGIRMPANHSSPYIETFVAIYPKLTQQYHINLVPELLANVASTPDYFQADNIHPTALAQPIILENVWQQLQPLL